MDPEGKPRAQFQIDRISEDSPALKDQSQWNVERARAQGNYKEYSIFALVPAEGKVGIAPMIYTLERSGIPTIDMLTRLTPEEIEAHLLKNKFGKPIETDLWEKIILLREKALELVKRHPILLSKN